MDNITDSEKYDIRYSILNDETFLKEALADKDTRKWYPPSTDSDVKIFVRNWAGFSRYQCSLTATYENQVIGMATIFLMPYVKVAHLAMLYVIVKKEFQQKGVGTSLMKNINHLAKTKFKLDSLHLEIFEGCQIEPLLLKSGYKEVFVQENFVELDDKLKSRKVFEVDLVGK
ncbi:MAG: hypothetical protein S4CHLAM20_03500 [Chlamydiia bacterium]|nr:hypothetical protein [Chlamydiia bacterium]